MHLDLERDSPLDGAIWEFPRPGWWVVHVALIGGAVYLGYCLGRRG